MKNKIIPEWTNHDKQLYLKFKEDEKLGKVTYEWINVKPEVEKK